MKPARRPEQLVLLGSLIFAGLVLLLFAVDLYHARQRELDEGARRTRQFSVMVSENSARAFEVVEALLRELATDFGRDRAPWPSWPDDQIWEALARRHSKSLPAIRQLMLVDPQGNIRAVSSRFEPTRQNIADRDHFIALRDGQGTVRFGPEVESDSGRYVYGFARRIEDGERHFAGAILVTLDPDHLQEFCWPARLSDAAEAVLVDAKGRILASCRPSDLSQNASLVGTPADERLFGGALRGALAQPGVRTVDDYLVAVQPVPAFGDLAVLTVVPVEVLLASWSERRNELSALAALIVGLILLSGWYQQRQLQLGSEMNRRLAENQALLEARIAAATAALVEQRNAAERANRGKSRFLAAASHDLRQPLHALALFVADLQRQVAQDRPQDLPRLAGQIAASTAVLGELLDALLDLSRLDVQGVQPRIASFPLQTVFERIAQTQRRAAVDREITLRFHPTGVWVESDPTMLERMIANLVANALRYTPPHGRVLIGARCVDDAVRIEVRDNGIGIPREHQAAIFAEFYQVDNTAREHGKGLGLGLSIVDRLARALGIEVGLRSAIGWGTVFSLRVARGEPARAVEMDATESGTRIAAVHVVQPDTLPAPLLQMIREWGYPLRDYPEAAALAAHLPVQGWVLVAQAGAAAVDAACALEIPLIVLADADAAGTGEFNPAALRARCHVLTQPVRPAKLRALLRV